MGQRKSLVPVLVKYADYFPARGSFSRCERNIAGGLTSFKKSSNGAVEIVRHRRSILLSLGTSSGDPTASSNLNVTSIFAAAIWKGKCTSPYDVFATLRLRKSAN